MFSSARKFRDQLSNEQHTTQLLFLVYLELQNCNAKLAMLLWGPNFCFMRRMNVFNTLCQEKHHTMYCKWYATTAGSLMVNINTLFENVTRNKKTKSPGTYPNAMGFSSVRCLWSCSNLPRRILIEGQLHTLSLFKTKWELWGLFYFNPLILSLI